MSPKNPCPSIIWIESADSTNSELRRHIENIDNLSVIAASSQTEGRGQGDHVWYSSPGKNLTFSIFLRHNELLVKDILLVTCVIALAVTDYLSDKGVKARIKWPNDIWVGDRKICGILIENTLKTDFVSNSIVGVGLNLNETGWPAYIPNPVSLTELTLERYRPEDEIILLHKAICRRYAMMDTSDGRMSLQEEFGKLVFRLS